MSLALGILFCTAKKVSKKLPTEKTRFYASASLMALEAIWHWSFIQIDFSSHSFPLAWAFVVHQGRGIEYCDVVNIGHTFLYRQKSIKKNPNGKNSLLL
jgi:hypothetical protein